MPSLLAFYHILLATQEISVDADRQLMLAIAAMKNGTESRGQFNVRIPTPLRDNLKGEINRQGRKRDVVAERVFRYFLSLKPTERDAICAKAA